MGNFRPALRAAHPFRNLSDEAKQIIRTLEDERDAAKAAGENGDWWEGGRKKGVTREMAKQYKAGRRLMREKDMNVQEMLGIDTLGFDFFDRVGFEDDLEDGELEGLGDGDDKGTGGSQEVGFAPESEATGGEMQQDQHVCGEGEEALMKLMGEADVAPSTEEDGMDID
ncbi:MAG: hypothetical protein Q9185_007050 [Variospora sp. 1 TL-2023]